MLKLPKITPHSAAKHVLLRRYQERWFPILGRCHKSINHIDGLAETGEYQGGEAGSPQMAVEAAKAHVEKGALDPHVQIHFSFVEADPESAENLKARLSALRYPSSFKVEVTHVAFAETIGTELRS